jgi:hypothetical protein
MRFSCGERPHPSREEQEYLREAAIALSASAYSLTKVPFPPFSLPLFVV